MCLVRLVSNVVLEGILVEILIYLKKNGVTPLQELSRALFQNGLMTAVASLDDLLDKGLVSKETPGRYIVYYRLTDEGEKLAAELQNTEDVWD